MTAHYYVSLSVLKGQSNDFLIYQDHFSILVKILQSSSNF